MRPWTSTTCRTSALSLTYETRNFVFCECLCVFLSRIVFFKNCPSENLKIFSNTLSPTPSQSSQSFFHIIPAFSSHHFSSYSLSYLPSPPPLPLCSSTCKNLSTWLSPVTFSSSLPPGSAVTWVSICPWRGWWGATWLVGGASRRQRRRGWSSWRLQWRPWTRVETETHCYSNTTLPSAFHLDSTTILMKETRWSYWACGTGVCLPWKTEKECYFFSHS